MFRAKDKPLEDKEFPDEEDLLDDDGEDEQPSLRLSRCPACGETVYEQAQQCPHCKEWISPARATWRDSRKWYVRGGLYLTKTLLLNWLFWLVLAAIAAIVAFREIFQ